MVGLVIAPLLMLIGLWLCLEGMWHGKLSGGIFWVGSFLALVGGLWLVSDRFDSNQVDAYILLNGDSPPGAEAGEPRFWDGRPCDR